MKKKLVKEDQIKDLILELRDNKFDGINVTVPFKNVIIPFVDGLTPVSYTHLTLPTKA